MNWNSIKYKHKNSSQIMQAVKSTTFVVVLPILLEEEALSVVWWVKYDTQVNTKMLASDWLLFIAANQKPEFWHFDQSPTQNSNQHSSPEPAPLTCVWS